MSGRARLHALLLGPLLWAVISIIVAAILAAIS